MFLFFNHLPLRKHGLPCLKMLQSQRLRKLFLEDLRLLPPESLLRSQLLVHIVCLPKGNAGPSIVGVVRFAIFRTS
jgi:hypothetical protein